MPRWHWCCVGGRGPGGGRSERGIAVLGGRNRRSLCSRCRWRSGGGARSGCGRGVAATLCAEIAREGVVFRAGGGGGAVLGGRVLPAAAGGLGGIATGAVLAWPLVRDARSGRPPVPGAIGLAAVFSLVLQALPWLSGAYVSESRAPRAQPPRAGTGTGRRSPRNSPGRARASRRHRPQPQRDHHPGAAAPTTCSAPARTRPGKRWRSTARRATGPGRLRRVLQTVAAGQRGYRMGAAAGTVRPGCAAGPGPGRRPGRDRPDRRRPGGPARRAGPGRLPDRAGGPDQHAQARAGAGSTRSRPLPPGRARPGGP